MTAQQTPRARASSSFTNFEMFELVFVSVVFKHTRRFGQATNQKDARRRRELVVVVLLTAKNTLSSSSSSFHNRGKTERDARTAQVIK